MATFSIADLMASPGIREMFQREAERMRKRNEAYRAAYPERVARVERQERGEFTLEEVEESRKRHEADDYPPTGFGDYLRDLDARALKAEG